MSEDVLVERRGHLAVVTLDRPERRNALSRALLLRLGAVGRELSQDPSVRAAILTGTGDRAFSAGADLKERRGMSDDDVRAQLDLYASELGWLSAPYFPTIAAINGAALGGGLELALCCDLRVAVADVELGLPETGLGIIPGAGGTQRLVRLVGEARGKQAILLGQRWTAREGLAIGLVNAIVETPGELLPFTIEFVRPIVEGAPIAQRAALRAIRAASELPLEQGLKVERECYEACLTSSDRREALLAFTEKRKPRFSGR